LDVSAFAEVIDQATRAFGRDLDYGTQMAVAARQILFKRSKWNLRLEVREAVATAMAECSQAEPFDCAAVQSCGTGTCKYAVGPLALLESPAIPGNLTRPQSSDTPKFHPDSALPELMKIRGLSL
jgi:hypothetical protein